MNMPNQKINLYKNDLPNDVVLKGDIAIDTEAMGLNHKRDRLCLIQISDEDGKIYIIQMEKGVNKAPNLEKLLTDGNIQKISHFARFDVYIIYL